MTGRFGELLVILLIVLLLFGAGRLPRLMADIGRGMRSLRQGLSGDEMDESVLELKATGRSQTKNSASRRKAK